MEGIIHTDAHMHKCPQELTRHNSQGGVYGLECSMMSSRNSSLTTFIPFQRQEKRERKREERKEGKREGKREEKREERREGKREGKREGQVPP